jgi:hypothetical protein
MDNSRVNEFWCLTIRQEGIISWLRIITIRTKRITTYISSRFNINKSQTSKEIDGLRGRLE